MNLLIAVITVKVVILSVFLTPTTNSNTVIIQDGVINIKPLVNLTINKLGLLDGDNDGSSEKADSPTNVLKSMFRIWNPEVGGESDEQWGKEEPKQKP